MSKKPEIIFVEEQERKSRPASLKELLSHQFIIPSFQRPYAWDDNHFEDLLNTIKENQDKDNRKAFLGSVIVALKKNEQSEVPGKQQYFLIDGQQRITSFLLLLRFIFKQLKQLEKQAEQEITETEKSLKMAKDNKKVDDVQKYTEQKKDKENETKRRKEKLTNIEQILQSHRIKRESSTSESLEKNILKYILDKNSKDDQSIKEIKNIFEDKIKEDMNGTVTTDTMIKYLDYILDSCIFCFLTITGDNSEDYAIDIFNSLNSTGEPLTAFEILKSLIYKKFNSDIKNRDELTEKFNKIEKDLEKKKFKKIKQNKYTDRLLLFINMMTENLQVEQIFSFRDKRNLLDKIISFPKDKVKELIDCMYSLHTFILNNWENKKALFQNNNLDVESKLIFNFMQSISHDRIIPVLYRFKDTESDLNKVIKICAGFTCLWRGGASDGGTDRIDNKYEKVIKEIYSNQLPDIQNLNHIILNLLKKERSLKNNLNSLWVDKFKDIDIYKKSKLARFLLFIAFHKRDFDTKTKEMNNSQLKFLTTDNWTGKEYKTIEHIIPKSQQHIDKIGNLILLPENINQQVGAKDFEKKKTIYKKCLQTDSQDMPYIPILKEIVSYDNFNKDIVNKRGERLARSLWQTLAEEWLDWKT